MDPAQPQQGTVGLPTPSMPSEHTPLSGSGAPLLQPLPTTTPLTPSLASMTSVPLTKGSSPEPTTERSENSVAPSLEDKDLIEKEWVERAKAIVNKTSNDPYAQSQQLTQLRVEYMKKHYNKSLRLSDK